MELAEIVKDVYHVRSDTKQELGSAFLRFQEHYESPKFKGKIFTLPEFKKWYIANSENGKKTGKFTYFSDWDGFNIPSSVLKPFYEGKFDPLSRKEKAMLRTFEKVQSPKFYVIGTQIGADPSYLDHEVAHGLYFANEEYHGEARRVLEWMDQDARGAVGKYLSNLNAGYDESVFDDETQAYLIGDTLDIILEVGFEDEILAAHNELFPIFKHHYKKHPVRYKRLK